MPKALDLKNKKFGKLLVLYQLSERKNGKIVWHCKCDCGNECDIISTSLTGGKTMSCGCYQRQQTSKSNSYDLRGQKFNFLTPLERVPGGKWKCQCDCGNITYVKTTKLTHGLTKSCGCYQKSQTSKYSLKDLTGKRFGKLIVLRRDPNFIKNVKWICQCDCGIIKSIYGNNLISGNTLSCGCLKNNSHGELKIAQILDENNIPYIREYTFKDCKNPKTNHLLRFDFYVNNQYLIEYDGIQHYKDNNYGWNENIENIKYKDKIKTDYCKKNNIPLIRIPYTKYDSLTLQDLLI